MELRNASALFLQTNIQEHDIDKLGHHCRLYFNVHALFDRVNLTTWTVGHVIPAHTKALYRELGLGLGVNSVQGRESKHLALKQYLEHSVGVTPEKRWEIAFRHEFGHIMWLPSLLPKKSHNLRRDRNHIVTLSDSCCQDCGTHMTTQLENGGTDGTQHERAQILCELCSREIMKEIRQSCEQGTITPRMVEIQSGLNK